MYDLFISYSSKDRPWAQKFYEDLLVSYPQLQIFFDRTSIMAGSTWRQELDNAIYASKHLLFFWSKNADSPNAAGTKEVDPEIEGFLAHRRLMPVLDDSAREIFPVNLEGTRGGGVLNIQGFPAFQAQYDASAADLGVSKLEADPSEWERMIRKVGDAILLANKKILVFAGIIATNDTEFWVLDRIHGKKKAPDGPTLDDFLAGFGLTWAQVRNWYGRSALEWRPHGGPTIVTLLEEVRVRVNAKLSSADQFQWKYLDLTNDKEYAQNVRDMYKEPSVLLFDPISLYDSICPGALLKFKAYVRREESVMISLSPNVERAGDLHAMYLMSVSNILEDYLQPEIPPGDVFGARCALDLQRTSQIDALIRNRIRYPRLLEKREAERIAAREEAKETAGLR